MKYILILFVSLSILNFSNVRAQAQEPSKSFVYKTGDPTSWKVELDAVIAAPENHKILLENDKVRVLEVVLKPGEREPIHHHRWPSVLYIQEAGDFIDFDMDGNVVFDSRDLRTPMKFPFTMWKEAEAPHSVENISKTIPIRLIRVETKN